MLIGYAKQIEQLMLLDGYSKEDYNENEWTQEVIEVAGMVEPYLECNGSIREAYHDCMH